MKVTEIPLKKIMMKNDLKGKLSLKSQIKAESDYHARRKPRPCGLTVHPGIGCTNRCIYCYIQDMGFSFTKITPYGLTGRELAYALLSNPFFYPTRQGTYIAIGSITEPFHQKIKEKTMQYLLSISRLGNPIQFSTKEHIDRETARVMARLKSPISPLITITTIHRREILEPQAPPIYRRLQTIRNLKREGMKPMLFLRPIIPGITDVEIDEIIGEAKHAGVIGVVIGGLRITRNIIERMRRKGIDVEEIMRRLKGKKLSNRQIYVGMRDLKEKIVEVVRENGLKIFKSACCATAYVSETPCINICWEGQICTKCNNKCVEKIPEITLEEIGHLTKMIIGRETKKIVRKKYETTIYIEKIAKSKVEILKYGLQVLLRNRIRIRFI